MELKIGDNVRYLDAVGGGIITAFKGKDLVIVLEADGFETPVMRRQCVVVQPEEKTSKQATPPKQPIADKQPIPVKQPEPAKHPLLNKRPPLNIAGEKLVIKLAYLPEEDQPLNDASVECYLINDSPYELLYNYALINNQAWMTIQSGSVEPNTKLYLETFSRDTLNDRGHVGLQVVALKSDAFYKGRQPLSKELKLEPVKFYKIHCFKDNPYFDEDALLVDVFDE